MKRSVLLRMALIKLTLMAMFPIVVVFVMAGFMNAADLITDELYHTVFSGVVSASMITMFMLVACGADNLVGKAFLAVSLIEKINQSLDEIMNAVQQEVMSSIAEKESKEDNSDTDK